MTIVRSAPPLLALLAVAWAAAPGAAAAHEASTHHLLHNGRPAVHAGPVTLAAAPGTALDAVARRLSAADIASSTSHGQQPLVLIGSAPLSTVHHFPPALFVQLQSAPLCGSAGCATSVYLDTREGWRQVLDSVSGPITVLWTKHDHMHDLLIGRHDRWIWSHGTYHDTLGAPSLLGLKRSVERHQQAVANGTATAP